MERSDFATLAQSRATHDKAWLQLALRPGLGPSRLRVLHQRYGSAEAILALQDAHADLPPALLKALNSPPDPVRYASAEEWLALPEHWLLTWDHPRYPPQLLEIHDPPPLLFVAGNPALLSDPQIALVGTRKPSPSGRQNAFSIAAELARAGLCITSGLALGIDGAAHSGALSVGGSTVAVMGCGLNHCYPRGHQELARQILTSGGALISEFWPGSAPKAGHFPRRNRIISGLSLGVLVVEAASISGSLITARQALEQGREVFALPGAVQNPQSHGCHELIRQGATLVEHGAHILETLQGPLRRWCSAATAPAAATDSLAQVVPSTAEPESVLLSAIEYAPTALDQLVQRTGLTITELQTQLLELELSGRVERVPGGVQRLR